VDRISGYDGDSMGIWVAELEEAVAQFRFSVTSGQTLSISLSGKDIIYARFNLSAVQQ